MAALRFGVTTGTDLDEVRRLEDLGVDSLWVGGHVTAPHEIPELMVNLVRVATVTTRVQVGAAALVLPLYNPAVVAKQIADLDRYTGGRIVLGVGAGGDYPGEFRTCGVPLDHRGDRLTEGIQLLRKFWTGQEVTHDGRYYPVERGRIHPPPAQGPALPIVVAGRRHAVRRAATVGDGWMPYFFSVRAYRESVADIRALAEAAGRDLSGYGWYHYAFVLLDDDEERAREQAARRLGAGFRGVPGQDYGPLVERVAAVGRPETVAARLREYAEAGVEHFILMPLSGPADRDEMITRILAEVVPQVATG